jgi:hypothetical protein
VDLFGPDSVPPNQLLFFFQIGKGRKDGFYCQVPTLKKKRFDSRMVVFMTGKIHPLHPDANGITGFPRLYSHPIHNKD